ncbi:PPE domain-containing protein [Actinophytocola sp. KF-1]
MPDTPTTPPAEETPAAGDPAEGTRWRGYTHKELYLMLHDGPGAAAAASPSRRWAEISSTLTEIGEDLKKALDLTGSGWQGRAAGAAYDRLSTTVAWATNAGANAGLMRTAVEDQADHIAKARADMPAPEGVPPVQPDPTVAPAVQVLQTQVDAEPAEAGASSAEERAVEVMAAYENNTKTTTASLANFDMPQKLLPNTGMSNGHGGGLLGILPTVVSGLVGHGGPSRHDDHPRNDWRGPRNDWHGQSTGGSSAQWEERRPLPPAPQAPGKTMGVSREPLLAPRIMMSGGTQERTANNRGGSGGGSGGGAGGGGGAPAAGGSSSGQGPMPQKTPSTNAALPPAEQFQQAAAASQAAATAHSGAGAPIAPATGAVGGGQEKMALRRFGMDAIGSSQWFGDTEEPAVGESPKRRFDLRESAEVTESVSILDEEHKLPPTVIGEGGR